MQKLRTLPERTVRLEDLRVLRYCNSGVRAFLSRHGMTWSDFLKDGISFERLEEIGDAMGQRAISQAKRRSNL